VIPLIEPWIPEAYADAVRAQIRSGFLGPGTTTVEFAKSLAGIAGTPRAIATVSGTIALTVAAHALGLAPGDEVLVPAYGVISTINGFASMGLRPRLVEIDRTSGCMDLNELERSITGNTRAVCFVNFSGYTGGNLIAAKELCDRRGIPLIEDAACALGHSYQGRAAGSIGTIGTYSFSVPKVVTTGQGGAVTSKDVALLDRAEAFIDQGDLEWRKTNENRAVGTNLRFNDIQASLGLCQLRDLPDRLARRRSSYAVLRSRLGDCLYAVPGAEAPLHNIVFTADPDELVRRLRAHGVMAVRQYRTLSQHPAYRALADRVYPNADFWTAHSVYLPFGMALDADAAGRMADALAAVAVSLYPCA
jgi:perosamine synthetase